MSPTLPSPPEGRLQSQAIVMADFQNDLYMPPPGDYSWRPMRGGRLGDDGHMNMPIVALLLSILLFILFLWFFLSPLCTARRGALTEPRPIDVEDAYFVDERAHAPYMPHYIPALGAKRDLGALPSPPPAYTSRPGSPACAHVYPPRTFSSTESMRTTSLRRLLALPRALVRSASAPPSLVISKPIPLPEAPLPGPDIDMDAWSATEEGANPGGGDGEGDHTRILPCAAPVRSVSESTLHPPAVALPVPSHAVVHDAQSRSPHLKAGAGYRPVSVGRMSVDGALGGWNGSVSESRIGIAF